MNTERIALLNKQIREIEIRQNQLVFNNKLSFQETKEELIALQALKESKDLELLMIKPLIIPFAVQLRRYASMLFV